MNERNEFDDPQGWDAYWERKGRKATRTYDVIAGAYRNLVIKRRLDAELASVFQPGARLLHAGCGSGGVDAGLHSRYRITAVDISLEALELYRRNNPDAREVRRADIFKLPFEDRTFDGVYNLGVVEHFHPDELRQIFREFHRVLIPRGKFLAFWPHAYATSVAVLGAAHWMLNDVLHKKVTLHPAEVCLIHSEDEARHLLTSGGFDLRTYHFGARDFFVQAVVTADRSDTTRE